MPGSINEATTKLKFVEVPNPSVLMPFVKERLPLSCLMHNQILQWPRFKQELKFYTIGSEINSNTWFITNNIREDYAFNVSISAPITIAEGREQVPAEVKECIYHGGLINWDDLGNFAFFSQTPRLVSDILVDICANEKGYVTEVHPCLLYYMDVDQAVKLDVQNDDPSVEIRRLNSTNNEVDFLLKTWQYAVAGSDIALNKCLARNPSGGVFVDGKCVCGVYTATVGFQSALYTLKEFRKRGYAKQMMKYTFREYGKEGCIPCCTIEVTNPRAKRFHDDLNMKIAGMVNGLFVRKTSGE